LAEQNVSSADRSRRHRRHRDQFSVFDRRLHAGSRRPEPNLVAPAQQLTSDLVKHREGGADHEPRTSVTTRSSGVNQSSWQGTASTNCSKKPRVKSSPPE